MVEPGLSCFALQSWFFLLVFIFASLSMSQDFAPQYTIRFVSRHSNHFELYGPYSHLRVIVPRSKWRPLWNLISQISWFRFSSSERSVNKKNSIPFEWLGAMRKSRFLFLLLHPFCLCFSLIFSFLLSSRSCILIRFLSHFLLFSFKSPKTNSVSNFQEHW